MVWVKFHDELRRGAKRGLPRSVRFIFMELCLESRPGRGVMDLPLGMPDADAICDVLGGNRKEVELAIKLLGEVPKPTEREPNPRAMVELSGDVGARQLVIPSWSAWNSGQEAPGASTERSRRHRGTTVADDCDDDATTMQRPLHGDATVGQRSGNGSATLHRGEKKEKRAEEIQDSTPPTPPPGGGGKRRRTKAPRASTGEPEAHVRYAQAYAEGITEATGQPFTVPLRGGAKTALWQLAATHAKVDDGTALEGEALLSWFQATAAEYRKARAHSRRDQEGGFSPVGCQIWIDAGRPAGPPAPAPRATPPQPAGDVEKFRDFWLEQYAKAAFGYGAYVEAEHEASREAYGQLLALAETQGGKAWAKHWVDRYLVDPDRFFADKRHAFSALLSAVRREPARYGAPGSKKSAPTDRAGAAGNFRPAGTLQPMGGWTPQKSAFDVGAALEAALSDPTSGTDTAPTEGSSAS